MFGQHHDENTHGNEHSGAANITEDGTLGIPAPVGMTSGGSNTNQSGSGGGSSSSASSPSLPQSFRQTSPVAPPSASPASDDMTSLNDKSDAPEPSAAPEPELPEGDFSTSPAPDVSDSSMPADLMGLKQQALQQLKPLVGHLDQTPEEKFRTTMMMIQAADDKSLINQAYEAANAIPDEKIRAQALLDVVNEINYFTSQDAPQA